MYNKEKFIAMINNLTKSQLIDMVVHLQMGDDAIDEILEGTYYESQTKQSQTHVEQTRGISEVKKKMRISTK